MALTYPIENNFVPIRYYRSTDTYNYPTDNRPLTDLVTNLTILASGLDGQNAQIQSLTNFSSGATGYASLNGNSTLTFNAANSAAGTQEVIPRVQGDSLYTPISFSQYGGALTNTVVLTQAQTQGQYYEVGTGATTNFIITVPAPFSGGKVRFISLIPVGISVTVQGPSSMFLLPDGSSTASLALPTVFGASIEMVSDGVKWYGISTQGQVICAPATALNQAVPLSQALFSAPINVSSSTTLVNTQSGSTVYCGVNGVSSGYVITLPSPQAGLRYRFIKLATGGPVSFSFTGSLFTPDGGTQTSPWVSSTLSAFAAGFTLLSDGVNWYMTEPFGLPVVSAAVQGNQAVQYNQLTNGSVSFSGVNGSFSGSFYAGGGYSAPSGSQSSFGVGYGIGTISFVSNSNGAGGGYIEWNPASGQPNQLNFTGPSQAPLSLFNVVATSASFSGPVAVGAATSGGQAVTLTQIQNFTQYLNVTGVALTNGKFVYGLDTGGTQRALIGMDGSNLATVVNSAGTRIRFVNQAYNVEIFSCDNSGNITATGNVTAYSDERIKKNWQSLSSTIVEDLALVKSGRYERTDTEEPMAQVGVSAQSLQKILPECVQEGSTGMLSVAYGNAALAMCVELAKEIQVLKKRIQILEAKQ